MSARVDRARGSLANRLVALFCLGALAVMLLVGTALALLLRSELRTRDMAEIDGKTAAVAHHLSSVSDLDGLPVAMRRLTDTAVGHAHLQLGLRAGGRWLLRPGDGVAELLGGRDVASMPTVGFESLRDGGRSWWVRRVTQRVEGVPGGFAHAIVAVDVSDAQRVQDRFNVALVLIGTTGLLLMAALAWWATRRGLAPLARVAADAERVTAQRLGEPLAIEEAPAEIRGVVAGINTMLARLDDSFRSLERFSADIAHELRTPLNSLMLRVEVTLSRERSLAEYREALLGTMRELEQLHRMVSDMLFLARAERGMAALKAEDVDLAKEARDVLDYFEPLATDRGLEMLIEGQARVGADRLMVRRAITNLVSNAVRYSEHGSTIRVSIEEREGGVILRVRNRCEPLAPRQIEHLFDRFARGDHARERQPDGSGLGLAIVRSIMTLHGGAAVARATDDGIEVELNWPRRPGD